jgi:hypothetical protein
VEDGVDLVFAKHSFHLGRRRDVALLEREVRSAIEDARVVECCAVVELVVGNDVVVGIRQSQVSDEPASDEACPAGDENISRIVKRLEPCVASEYRRLPPQIVREV